MALRRALLVVGGTLLVVMGCLPASSQPVESRAPSYWLGVARDAEHPGDLSAAYYAYREALARQPDNPLLNLTVMRLRLRADNVENASECIVRATRGFLQNPRAEEQIADELMLRKGDSPPHWEPSSTIGSRLAVPPLLELPAPLRRQAMETFPSPKLFREPQVEVLAWPSLEERERAAQPLEELVLAGAVEDATWGAILHHPLGDSAWWRALAQRWEARLQQQPYPALLRATLQIRWQQRDTPALRRLLPVVRQMVQGDAEFVKWYSRWLEQGGWLEGKEVLPDGKAPTSPPASAPSRLAQLQEAVARGDLERAQRVLLEVTAQQAPLQVTVTQDGILREMLRNGRHDLVKQLFPPETDLFLTSTMVAEQLLLGTLLEEQELAYWLDRLCQQNAQKCLGVVRNTARRLSEDAPEQAIWLLEHALNRFPHDRELVQTLAELYQRTGYAHRAQRLRAQSQPSLPLRDGGEPTTPPEDLPSRVARAEERLRRDSVTGASPERLLEALLETAALYARLSDGAPRAQKQAERLLLLHPAWQEGLPRAEALFRQGIPAIVPFTLWLNEVYLEKLLKYRFQREAVAISLVRTLRRLASRRLTVALLYSIAVTLHRAQAPPPADLNLELAPSSLEMGATSPPLPPDPFDELFPAEKHALVQQLPPDLRHPDLFQRTWSQVQPAFFRAMRQAYPDSATCVLHELVMETLQSPGGASAEALRRVAERLQRATHWNSFSWQAFRQVLQPDSVRRHPAEAIALIRAALPHAPEREGSSLKGMQLVYTTLHELERSGGLPEGGAAERLQELRQWLMASDKTLSERMLWLQLLATGASELALVLLEEPLPDLLLRYPPASGTPLTHLEPALQMLEQVASSYPAQRARADTLTNKILDYAEQVALDSSEWQNAAWRGAVTRTGRQKQALHQPKESLQRPDMHLVGVVDATLDMQMDVGTRTQVRDALLQWLTRQRPSLSNLTAKLSISGLGRLSSYTLQEGRHVYSFRPRPQGVALWGEVLDEYVHWYPALLPLEGARPFLLLTGGVYAREGLREALPAWRELLQTLLDRLGSAPEDLRALAPELLRSIAPMGTAPGDFAEEVRGALQQRERRYHR